MKPEIIINKINKEINFTKLYNKLDEMFKYAFADMYNPLMDKAFIMLSEAAKQLQDIWNHSQVIAGYNIITTPRIYTNKNNIEFIIDVDGPGAEFFDKYIADYI